MEFKTLIKARRSVRKFSEKRVERELLFSIVRDVARYAPSSRNSHSTRFMIVDDRATIERLSTMRDYGSSFMKDAPAVIVVMGDRTKTDLWKESCSISTTMLLLALVDAGLKGCWVHVDGRPQLRQEPGGKQAIELVRELLSIPEECDVLCCVACGYSDFEPAPLPEWEPEQSISFF